MFNIIFELVDKTGRKIILTKERWSHIRQKHGLVEDPEEIQQTILNSDKSIFIEEKNKVYFYKYFKHKKHVSKFLKVIVKYLNDRGYVSSAHFTRKIQ